MPKPITIRDVARRAAVSPGTVSRVMGGHRGVAETTRRRVLESVEALGYRPNPAAQRLSTGKSLTVAVTVPFFTLPSVSARLNGAINLLAGTAYDLIIHNIQEAEERPACFQNIPHRSQADGLLIISISPLCETEVASLMRAEIPIVMIDADHPALTRVPRVVVDDEHGGRLATAARPPTRRFPWGPGRQSLPPGLDARSASGASPRPRVGGRRRSPRGPPRGRAHPCRSPLPCPPIAGVGRQADRGLRRQRHAGRGRPRGRA
jgi:hypothetical protein